MDVYIYIKEGWRRVGLGLGLGFGVTVSRSGNVEEPFINFSLVKVAV